MIEDRREMDQHVADPRTVEQVAADLGLQRRGKHFFCPGCQPEGHGTPEMVIKAGNFQCFRCGALGDVVGLVKLARRYDLEEAMEWLEQERRRADEKQEV